MKVREIRQTQYKNGYKRAKPTQGVMHSPGECINPLPQIGDIIVIEDMVILNGIARYQLSTSRLDPWSRPRLYTVHGFTHGDTDVLNPYNKMECTYTTLSGVVLKQHISTIPIVTGSMRAVKASPAKLKLWRYL